MSMFGTYSEPQQDDFDSYAPTEHYDRPLIVKVNEHRTGMTTKFCKPGETKDGIFVDLVDLLDGKKCASVLWNNGALVDGLKPHVGGQLLVIRIVERTSKNGATKYPVIQAASAEDMQLAEQYVGKFGNPFAPALTTPAPAAAIPAQSTGSAGKPDWA